MPYQNIYSFKQCIARISISHDLVVGSGILISNNRILTCAHVVQNALSLLEHQQDQIEIGQTEVKAQLPFISSLPPTLNSTIIFIDWERDVAMLKLPANINLSFQPFPFISLINDQLPKIWGHSFRALGFPIGDQDGVWATGVFREEITNGTVQLDGIMTTGKSIKQGFSGGPVLSEELNGVAGLLARVSNTSAEKVAYMIPVSILVNLIDGLPFAAQEAVGNDIKGKKERSESMEIDTVKLRENMGAWLTTSDLKTICFDMGIDYEDIEGNIKKDKVVSLIRFAESQVKLEELISNIEKINPHRDWRPMK